MKEDRKSDFGCLEIFIFLVPAGGIIILLMIIAFVMQMYDWIVHGMNPFSLH